MADRVLLISEAPIATVQLLERILQHLEHTTGLSTQSRLLSELTPDDFSDGTYPLLVRSCSPLAHSLVSALVRTGTPYGFYIDDNFWLLDPNTPLGRHYAAWPTRRRLDAIVRDAKPAIAATPLLRDWLAPRAHAVQQLDSFFDFTLVERELIARPDRVGLRVGFAASASRGKDLAAVLDELLGVLDEYPELELEIIGADSDALPEHNRVTTFPYLSSYAEYLAFQRSRAWDIGIAPLGSAASNQYKTDNKYREYAALGIAGIYQQSAPYAAVRDGDTGLVAGGDRTWGDALRWYCTEPGLIDAVREAARRDAQQRISLEAVAPQWEAFFAAAPSVSDQPGRAELLRRELARPLSARARRAQHIRLLWEFGLTHLAERGLWRTLGSTARYLLRRRPLKQQHTLQD